VVPKDFCAFSRNSWPNLAQYMGERPEITSHDEEPNRAKTTKGKIKSNKGTKDET